MINRTVPSRTRRPELLEPGVAQPRPPLGVAPPLSPENCSFLDRNPEGFILPGMNVAVSSGQWAVATDEPHN